MRSPLWLSVTSKIDTEKCFITPNLNLNTLPWCNTDSNKIKKWFFLTFFWPLAWFFSEVEFQRRVVRGKNSHFASEEKKYVSTFSVRETAGANVTCIHEWRNQIGICEKNGFIVWSFCNKDYTLIIVYYNVSCTGMHQVFSFNIVVQKITRICYH